jgi:glycine/D-amino acid oxidase-like deaminating enzyme
MKVLIVGGGVIGVSIAYFLARRGAKPVVIERSGIACAASGKSGGFLALDWCDGTPLQALARRSFELHAELADQLDGEAAWGYRRMTAYGAYARARGETGGPASLGWLAPGVMVHRQLGTTATTAQVNPAEFSQSIMRAAEERGAELRIGAATGLLRDDAGGSVRGVIVDGEPLTGDAVVIAMGPWSIFAADWLPLPRVFGLKGHSLLFETGAAIPGEALFLEYQEASGALLTPEVYPRTNGITFISAISSESPVPLDPADVEPDPGVHKRIEALAARISPELRASNIVARQACYRPVTQDGLPLIGRMPGAPEAYVATGHSVWGILNAPATGEAMAEVILDGAAGHVDLSPFDPRRLRPVARSS